MDSRSRILVVDDDPSICRVLCDVLGKNKDYDVASASDGLEALEFLENKSFDWDLVITDMMMPRMNGHGLIMALTENAPHIATLVLTAHKNDSNVIECLKAGAYDYELKPVKIANFLRTVKRAIDRHSRMRDVKESIHVKSAMQGWVELTAPTDYEYVERFQKFTALLGDSPLSVEAQEGIRVVISELGQNAVEWGNLQDRGKRIHLSYCIFSDRLVFKIEDEGEGFRPENVNDPSVDPIQHIMNRMKEGKRAGGYGIFLSKKMMDEVSYSDKGNVVLLTKYFSGASR